ncbi:MAG: pitrilysin family protein [Phycisphaerae bacterium]|nr:insulinase family protein [Phycisphaerales bacterium]
MRLLHLIAVVFLAFSGCSKGDDVEPVAKAESAVQDPPAKEVAAEPGVVRPLPEGATRHKLENGLTYILYPTNKAKHIALDVLFGVGGSHDPEGKSGLSHLVEHIYVTAEAGKEPSRTVHQYMQRYPLGWNAQTGDDYTIIATVFEKDRLANEIEDAAARMGFLNPTQADLDREVPRLLEEVGNMFGGMPQLAVMNHARDNLFPSTTGHRKGGVPEQVKLIGLNDVIHWWLDHYKPSNALIVLAGDFDADEAKGLIEKHFGDIPAGNVPIVVDQPGPAKVGAIHAITITPKMPGAKPFAGIAFAAPMPNDKHYAACLVIVSRMFQNVMASGTQVMFSPVDDPAVISISAPLQPDKSDEESIAALRVMLDAAIKKPLTPMETQLTKKMLGMILGMVEFPRQMFQGNLYGVAYSIGRCEQLQVDSAKLAKALDALTDKDIQAAAAAIFDAKKQVAVVVKPN